MTERRFIYATPKRLYTAWAISFVCMLGLTGASIQYANYVDRKSNQNWCELIVDLDERYKRLPPDATPEAKEFAETINALRRNLECK